MLFSIERRERDLSFSCHVGDCILLFLIFIFRQSFFQVHKLSLVMSYAFSELSLNLGKPLLKFFHISVEKCQDISFFFFNAVINLTCSLNCQHSLTSLSSSLPLWGYVMYLSRIAVFVASAKEKKSFFHVNI